MSSSKEKEAAFKLWQSTPVYLTAAGHEKLQNKLARLKSILPGLISETKRTRGYGDTSDNAEYKDAKMASRRAQRQILMIEDQLKKVVLIPEGPDPTGKIRLGSIVTLEDESGSQKTYQILGPFETNPASGKISLESPLGKALIGRSMSDLATVMTPNGLKKYKILGIR